MYHNLAITHGGALYAWGRNAEGQLGRPVVDVYKDDAIAPGAVAHGHMCLGRPALVRGGWESLGRTVVSAAASGVSSFVIDSQGELWAWGESSRGQLGLGPGMISTEEPQRVPGLEGMRMKSVSAGWGHALALSECGLLFAWGHSGHGRLGFKPATSGEPPPLEKEVGGRGGQSSNCPTKATVYAANAAVEAALKTENDALAGLVQWEPRRVATAADPDMRFAAAACGMDHSLAITGRVGGCGRVEARPRRRSADQRPVPPRSQGRRVRGGDRGRHHTLGGSYLGGACVHVWE
mmetsp:Transcript_33484/g.73076  ORF Transcript_33484/g.73076 Transcript_33484/m.73076 type:complete len:293 (+) Transcript_33484:392-1270(+)